MTAKLIVHRDTGHETEFPLSADEVKIGRTTQRNDLVLDDRSVSREHVVIRRDHAGFIIFDLESANGTMVNGARLAAPRRLANGDVIAIGKTTLTFQMQAAAPSGNVSFGELQDIGGTVMVSLVPEQLLSDLAAEPSPAEAKAAPIALPAPSDLTIAPSEGAGIAEVARLQKKAKILSLLYELARTLGTAFSLPDVYKQASEMLFSVTPADRCLILLKDPSTGELKPVSVEVSPRAHGFAAASTPSSIVVSRTITSRVMSEGVAILVYDAQQEFGGAQSVLMQAIRSVMCAPLKGKAGLLGLVYADRRDLLGRFEEDDLDLLSAIASQAAISIENTLAREQLQHEAQVRERLGRFLPSGVVDRVLAGEIKLGGVSQEITTLFADIRGFTPLSERTSPEVVVEVLNEHFTVMTDAIVAYGGTLDKYIGDSVMALFGAPSNNPGQDPINAVSAAVRMQRGMRVVNEKLVARSLPTIRIGVGINTGRAVVGEIGSEKQMNYTAIGDAVNTAARLESNAQPGQILVSASTASRLRDNFRLNPLPPIKLKGKTEPAPVFEVVWEG